jgi:hypothetical protein
MSEVATTASIAESVKPGPSDAGLAKAMRLPMQGLQLIEQCRREHWAKAPHGANRDDVRHPEFLVNVAKGLRRHDVVHLLADDESWQIEMIVEAVTLTGVECTVVKNIARRPLDTAQKWLDAGHYVEYRPSHSWCVVRAKDNFPIVSGQGSPEGAKHIFFARQPKPVA